MRFVAGRKPFGPFYWKKINDERRINAYFGGMEEWKSLRKWEDIPREELENFTQPPVRLDHGYDESKDESLLDDIADMRGAAEFRGGKCLSGSMTPGDLDTPLEVGMPCGTCVQGNSENSAQGRTLVSRLHGPQMGV